MAVEGIKEFETNFCLNPLCHMEPLRNLKISMIPAVYPRVAACGCITRTGSPT